MRQAIAILADDEDALRSYLKKQLAVLWPELVIGGEAANGDEAFELIEKIQPDIAFLDIKMPGLSGLEVAKKAAGKCSVVFITAYNEYAVNAFENEAVDYILKPVNDERLGKTVKRLKERLLSSMEPPDLSSIVEKITRTVQKPAKFLKWIKVLYKKDVRLIPVDEVYFFKASDKYTIVRTKDNEFLIRKTMKELSEELDPEQFWRVHRAAIVNVKAVHCIDRSLLGKPKVRFKGIQDNLTVSRSYTHLFKQM